MQTIVIAINATQAVMDRAGRLFQVIALPGRNMTMDDAIARAAQSGAEAIMITSSQKLTGEAIAKLPPGVRIVATSSVGFEHIDVAAAKARGLIVTNTPGVLTDATADLTLLLLLCACRRAREYQTIMEQGWRRDFTQAEMLGIDPKGRTLGIVGMGRIGRAVAARARAFGMNIAYCGRNRLPPELEAGARYFPLLEEMLPVSDILSLHAPAGPQTNKLMNAARFALLPKGAVFLNTARGSLVDEEALIGALASGHLFAAGLDVFAAEPAYDLRLRDFANVFFTPHMGSATAETRTAMGGKALDNIAAVLSGKPPIDPLWT
jgi:hydroxypyruvate reductase